MATGTRRAPAKKTAPKKPPVVEPEELEEEDDDLEELEEDETTETAPKGKAKGGQPEVNFGVADLVKLIKSKTGEDVTTRGLRTLIRKMARDGSGRVEREIVAGNRTRYDWSGPNDPEVKKIVAAYKAGELEADKQEKLAQLKENSAKKKAAAEKVVAGAGAKKKKKAAPVVEELDDDDEELEELEDEE